MDINITQIQSYSPEQIVSWAHSLTAVPSLIILFISIMLIFLLVGLIAVKNRGKYLTIWVVSFIASGIVLATLIYLPNTVQDITKWLKDFFAF